MTFLIGIHQFEWKQISYMKYRVQEEVTPHFHVLKEKIVNLEFYIHKTILQGNL